MIRTGLGFRSDLNIILVTRSGNRKTFFLLTEQDRAVLPPQQFRNYSVRSPSRAAEERDSWCFALLLLSQERGHLIFPGLQFCTYPGEGNPPENCRTRKGSSGFLLKSRR